MKINQISKVVFTITLLAFLISGCSTAKISDEDLMVVKNIKTDSSKALVYFVRPAFSGYAIKFHVTCDEKSIGSTNGKRFLFAYIEPGTHKFISKAENSAELFLKVEAGKTYFIEQKPKMGLLYTRNAIEVVDEVKGRKLLAKCKLSGDCPAYAQVNK